MGSQMKIIAYDIQRKWVLFFFFFNSVIERPNGPKAADIKSLDLSFSLLR